MVDVRVRNEDVPNGNLFCRSLPEADATGVDGDVFVDQVRGQVLMRRTPPWRRGLMVSK